MFYVYFLASKPYGTLYVGVTSELLRRVWEHKIKAVHGFAALYGVDRLVWFETHDSAEAAARPREADQGLEAGLEDQPDRERQPAMDGSLLKLIALIVPVHGWAPAFAGVTNLVSSRREKDRRWR